MKYLLIVLLLLLAGCGRALSFEEVQNKVAYCTLNGMRPFYEINAFQEVWYVRCIDNAGHKFDSKPIDNQGKPK